MEKFCRLGVQKFVVVISFNYEIWLYQYVDLIMIGKFEGIKNILFNNIVIVNMYL